MKCLRVALGSFCVVQFLAMVFSPSAFHRFFVLQTPVFDAAHYFNIAAQGYVEPPQAAFYPLWPLLLRHCVLPLTSDHAVLLASGAAFGLFIVSLFFWKKAALLSLPRSAAVCVACCYVLNPNSLFHILPYTESLTAVFASLFLFAVARLSDRIRQESDGAVQGGAGLVGNSLLASSENRANVLLACVSLFALSLSRPVALPFLLSAFAATKCVVFFRCERWQDFFLGGWVRIFKSPFFAVACLSALVVVVGYFPFGLHAQSAYGSFLAPFDAQKYWDRAFGFHWDIVFKPKSVSGSDNVLFWDLQGFYLPFVLLLLPLLGRFATVEKHRVWKPLEQLGHDWLYWLSAFFCAAHGAIAFLTYPIFMSLARHVFALPFFFYCFARVVNIFWHSKKFRRVVWGYAFISAAFLVYWWSRYGREGWIG
jgi:hypothetical protein